MTCAACPKQAACSAVYRCVECWRALIYCKECMVISHQDNPLHIVEKWTAKEGFWTRVTLEELGMVIRLGCHGEKPCDGRLSSPRDICVVTLLGLQTAKVHFCGCNVGDGGSPPHYVQLLEVGLWPGTWKLVRTVFSFQVLDSFCRLSNQGSITAHDYFQSLIRRTDGVIPASVRDRYREFISATREYQYVKWCMRRGVCPSQALTFGSLATLCPACPHVNVNICPEWLTRPEDKQHLDALYHAVDGNFTQNLKDKGSDADDLPLTLGAGYFADEHDAKKYFAKVSAPKNQTSSCNKFGAMGYYGHWGAVSGLVGLSCARHMFVLPGGGVDLKVGETWAAVDFLMLSALQPWMKLKLHISAYDINCQYRIHFWERLEKIRADYCKAQQSTLRSIKEYQFPSTRAAVGKFHEPAHKVECRLLNSFHYLPGAGQTDGEAPERIWAATTSLDLRTREMTPGNRHDTINYFHDDMNWRRTYGMAASLVKKYRTAIKYEVESATSLKELEDEIEAVDSSRSIVSEWELEKRKWDEALIAGSRAPSNSRSTREMPSAQHCPYEPVKSKGQSSLIARLSQTSSGWSDEKIAQLQDDFSTRIAEWNKVAQPSIGAAIATSLKRQRPTEQPSKLVGPNLVGTKLSRKFLDELRTSDILLPSSFPPCVLACNALADAIELELAMRKKDADDALDQVRAHLAASYSLSRHQAKSTTQQQKLRNRGPAQRLRSAMLDAASVYRRARVAMIALGMARGDPVYKPLETDDLKSFVVREQERQYGDSKNVRQSWIWGNLSFVDNDYDEGVKKHIVENLRVHWCRTKANTERWAEEKELVQEEMIRTLRFFDYQAHLWRDRAREGDGSAGSTAYVHK
ncbi:hypothetical protein BDY19DRAFT_899301 [Irpex rosettiformis]|uniref:Uncharacterized protein n=1 Tax=Irpex rosettiformis TaxID=378272 RepID=A0ACB8TPZ0_9APHY|nr:hypothetical protein BDY19DRAFT_899301 [Irpex rosettiformis]